MSKITDKNKEILEDLEQIGLNKNEAIVYTSLLKLGEVGASKIVRDTNLHGQTVYDTLHKLEEIDLVRHIIQKGRKKFIAQDPSVLVGIVERKKIIADGVAEKINKSFSTMDYQDIEIIKGTEYFFDNEIKLLKQTKNGDEVLVFGGSGDSYVKSMGNKIKEYDYQRTKRNIVVRYLGGEDEKKFLYKLTEERPLFKYKCITQVLSGVTNLTVYGDHTIIIYMFDETVTTIIIKNKKMVESYTGFFEGLWNIAK